MIVTIGHGNEVVGVRTTGDVTSAEDDPGPFLFASTDGCQLELVLDADEAAALVSIIKSAWGLS